MQKEGVSRLIAITSSGVEENRADPWFYKWFFRKLLMPTYKDMVRMEEVVESSGLQWTLVRPSYLVDKDTTDTRVQDRKNPPNGWLVSRAATANFMVNEAHEGAWIGKRPALGVGLRG